MKSNYWANRVDHLLMLGSQECDKELLKHYKQAYNNIELKMSRLYDKIMVDGKPSMTELYRFNRYYELAAGLHSILDKLGRAEVKAIGRKMTELYLATGELTNGQIGRSFAVINKEAANKVLTEVWCQDGKLWSDRIWEDKAKLQAELVAGLMDCIMLGLSRDKVIQRVAERMGVSNSNAARLVRTELNHVQTQSAIDRYKEAGYEQYQILAARDSRTSKICREQDNKVYNILEYAPGVTAPPFHPNCRTTVIPYE